jgi:antitoxin component YwqK of YwqJK toxin-antitoxin module
MKNKMKALLILVLALCVACNNTTKQIPVIIKTDKNLRFSLENDTKIPIKNIKVGLADTTLYFSSLNAMSKTEWIYVKSSYRYGYIKFFDYNDSIYEWRPKDYMGETLYNNGCMTFVFHMVNGFGKYDRNRKYTSWGYSLDCDSVNPDSGFTNKAEAKNLRVNGLKEGKWCEYNEQMSIDKSHDNDTIGYDLEIYKAGKVNGLMREYYKSGKIEAEMRFKDGHEYGVYKAYYESGKPEAEAFYNNNFQLDGLYKKYYENGKVKCVITYANGLKKDEKDYDENGNEIK